MEALERLARALSGLTAQAPARYFTVSGVQIKTGTPPRTFWLWQPSLPHEYVGMSWRRNVKVRLSSLSFRLSRWRERPARVARAGWGWCVKSQRRFNRDRW